MQKVAGFNNKNITDSARGETGIKQDKHLLVLRDKDAHHLLTCYLLSARKLLRINHSKDYKNMCVQLIAMKGTLNYLLKFISNINELTD